MYGYSEFSATLSEAQLGVVEYLDELFRGEFQLSRAIKYKVPFYEMDKKTIFYLNTLKNGNLELCFWSGRLMAEVFSEIDMKDRKMIGGYELKVQADLDAELIKSMALQGIKLQHSK